MTHAIRVTGAGAVCALGNRVSSVLSALDAPPTDLTASSRAAPFSPGDLPDGIGRRLGRQPALALAAILDALGGRVPSEDTALVLGTAHGAMDETTEFIRGAAIHGASSASPLLFSNSLHNAMASVAGRVLGLRGPAIVISNGDATFESALLVAAALLRNGHARHAIVGASEASNALCARALRVLGCLPEEEDAADATTGLTARGFPGGEGGGALVLETCPAGASGVMVEEIALGAACRAPAAEIESVQWLATGETRSVRLHREAWERLTAGCATPCPDASLPAARFGVFGSLGAVVAATEAARRMRLPEAPRGCAVLLQVPYLAPPATIVLSGHGLG